MKTGHFNNTGIVCPRCGENLDGWTHLEDGTPEPGDIAICLYCQAVNQYQEDMTLREAPVEVVAEYMLELSRAQNMISQLRVKGGR